MTCTTKSLFSLRGAKIFGQQVTRLPQSRTVLLPKGRFESEASQTTKDDGLCHVGLTSES
jgi:hypothetical protein